MAYNFSNRLAITTAVKGRSVCGGQRLTRGCGLMTDGACLLRGDPAAGAVVQQVQRKNAPGEHLVVEGAQVEAGAEFLLRALPQLAEPELAQLVAERLGRRGNVAVGLGLQRWLVHGARLAHEVDDLVAGPALRVDAGVDDQADSTEEFAGEAAVFGYWGLISAW